MRAFFFKKKKRKATLKLSICRVQIEKLKSIQFWSEFLILIEFNSIQLKFKKNEGTDQNPHIEIIQINVIYICIYY